MSMFRSSILLAMLALCGAGAGEAQARVVVGFGFGWPFYVPLVVPPPPVYYSPYYAAPAPYYAPPGATFSYSPQQAQPQSLAPYGGQRYGSAEYCQAGPYTCPLVAPTPPGGGCACPGNDGRRVRGQAY